MSEKLLIKDYKFPSNDFIFYFKNLYKDRGLKAIYQLFNRPLRRGYSRSLVRKYTNDGIGLEIGCGARTIAPVKRTILSDAFSEHGIDSSIAKVFFKGDLIPYDENTFDFILSEHVLEHISNPIKSLKEWMRVLKKDGVIITFLPHKNRTNDCYREITSLEHLIDDYEKDVQVDDKTHIDEWIQNVVERGLMPEHYKHLSKEKLLETASIHHHVWTDKEIIELYQYLGLEVIYSDDRVYDRRDSFVVIGRKTT